LFAVSLVFVSGPLLSDDDVFVVKQEMSLNESYPGISVDEVFADEKYTYAEWRASSLGVNPQLTSKTRGQKMARFRIQLRGADEKRSESMFFIKARQTAAQWGANYVCATEPSLSGPRREWTFEAYRLTFDGRRLDPLFIRLINTTPVRESGYIKALMDKWLKLEEQAVKNPSVGRHHEELAIVKSKIQEAVEQVGVAPPELVAEVHASSGPAVKALEEKESARQEAEPAKQEAKKEPEKAPVPEAVIQDSPVAPSMVEPVGKKGFSSSAGSASSSTVASPIQAVIPEPGPPRPEEKKEAVKASASLPEESSFPAPAEKILTPEQYQRREALHSGTLSLLLPGLGQIATGDKVRGTVTMAVETGLLTASFLVEKRVNDKLDRNLRDIYLYRTLKYATVSTWASQAVGTMMRVWPKDPSHTPTPRGALQRSIFIPGWGLVYSGHYELGLNVMAWEGYVAYWATKNELHAADRRNILAFTYWGQLVLTALMASHYPSASSPQLRIESDGEKSSIMIDKRFGGNP